MAGTSGGVSGKCCARPDRATRHMLARESWRGSSCRGLHALPSCQPVPDAQSSTASAQVFQLVLRSARRRLGGTLASGHLLRCLLADAARNRWQERRTARRARLRQLRACSAGPLVSRRDALEGEANLSQECRHDLDWSRRVMLKSEVGLSRAPSGRGGQ